MNRENVNKKLLIKSSKKEKKNEINLYWGGFEYIKHNKWRSVQRTNANFTIVFRGTCETETKTKTKPSYFMFALELQEWKMEGKTQTEEEKNFSLYVIRMVYILPGNLCRAIVSGWMRVIEKENALTWCNFECRAHPNYSIWLSAKYGKCALMPNANAQCTWATNFPEFN